MPLYEYQCDKCAHRFEVIQKYSDAPISICPKCGGPVMKLLSSPAIQFKGSGWYITDYAQKGKSDGGSSTKSGKSSSESTKSESSSDSGSKDTAAKSDSPSSSGTASSTTSSSKKD